MRAALLVAGKDLRQRLRDRSAIVVALVVPLALASVFSLTLADVAGDEATFEYAVADEDGGEAARTFVEEVLGGLERDGVFVLRRVPSGEEARRLVADGRAAAAFVVPAGFSEAVAGGEGAELRVAGDVDAPIATLVARSVAASYAGELDAARTAVAAALLAGADEEPEALGARAAALELPVALADVTAERRELDLTTFYSAGMAVFFLFFTVQFGVTTLLDERREGTLARLLAAPVRRGAVVAGKALTSIVLGVISMTVLVLATSLLLGAEWGNPLGVALLVLAGVVAATAVTALVATLARTVEQAGYWQAIVALVLGMLGGSFFPVAQAGGLLEWASLATPHAWFLRGLGDLAGGAGAAAVLPSVGMILAFAAVTGGLALARIGRLAQP